MKERPELKRVFDAFKLAQSTGDKDSILSWLAEIERIANAEAAPLTVKERRFVVAYAGEAKGNGTEACRLAGYKGSDGVLRVTAHRLLTKPNIQEMIRQLRAIDEVNAEMDRAECMQGFAAVARNDIADVFELDGSFDLQKAKARGVSKHIKAINFDKDTGKVTRVEVYSSTDARRDIGKHLGCFPTRITVSKDDMDRDIDNWLAEQNLPKPEETENELSN